MFKKHISGYKFINNEEIVKNKVAVYLIAERFHPALYSKGKYVGLESVITKNAVLDIIFVKIKIDNDRVVEKEFLLDTRKQ